MLNSLVAQKAIWNPGWQRTLIRGASGALAVQAAGAIFGFLTHILLARFLGRLQYGIYALALTWITILLIPALLGQSTSVLRFVPAYVQRREWGKLRALRQCSNVMVFATAAAIGFCGAALIWAFRQRFGAELADTFYVAFLALPILAGLQLSGALHQSLKRTVSAGSFNNILRPLVLLLVLYALVRIWRLPATATVAMAASSIGAFVALGASLLILDAAWPQQSRHASTTYEVRAWLRTGHRLLFVDGIGLVLNRIDVIFLGSIQGTTNLGPYYAAVQMAMVGSFGAGAVNLILAPMIAERYSLGDHDGLVALSRFAARIIILLSGLSLLGGVVFGRLVLGFFGPGFELAYVPLLILLAGQFVSAACGPVGFLMSMTCHEGALLKVFALGAGMNVALSVMLIPAVGMYGAAIASAAATAAWNIVALFFVRRNLRINPSLYTWLFPCPNRTF